MAIPNELIEASRIDGCSSLKMYTRVVVPVIKPAIASWAALTMISRWNDFFFPLIFLRSRSKYTLMVVISLLPVGENCKVFLQYFKKIFLSVDNQCFDRNNIDIYKFILCCKNSKLPI